MTLNTLKFRYRWDTSGGWLEVPTTIYKSYRIHNYLSSRSRYDKELQMVFLDGESDAQRFLDKIRKDKGMEPSSQHRINPLASEGELQIVHICEGRVSSIRQLPNLSQAKL